MDRLVLMLIAIGLGVWISYRRFEHALPFKIVRKGK
jgi:hypothetical protein